VTGGFENSKIGRLEDLKIERFKNQAIPQMHCSLIKKIA
jgi:hypothetical protein